jgi:hypothetical protein
VHPEPYLPVAWFCRLTPSSQLRIVVLGLGSVPLTMLQSAVDRCAETASALAAEFAQ